MLCRDGDEWRRGWDSFLFLLFFSTHLLILRNRNEFEHFFPIVRKFYRNGGN